MRKEQRRSVILFLKYEFRVSSSDLSQEIVS